MPANWSLILNVLLLVGVVVAIGRLMTARRQSLNPVRYQPAMMDRVDNSPYDAQPLHDDIIAVRKVDREVLLSAQPELSPKPRKPEPKTSQPQLMPQVEPVIDVAPKKERASAPSSTLMMFLLAKENRQFAGYELLQTVLASGLRFGDGQLFHRHQQANGQGSILCSLASATASGVFDLQNIGAFSVHGLCLFMQVSKNPDINAERFTAMLETARQLSEGLDAHLLDEKRKPLSEERISLYYQALGIELEAEPEYATA
jgi:cell division protein ZipA